MTFGEFKSSLRFLLASDTAMARNDEAIVGFYRKAVYDILSTAEPLTLITADRKRFTPYRSIDAVYFIREPEIPVTDADRLDMDEFLTDAVLNLVASYMTRLIKDLQHAQFYEVQARILIDKHLFETVQYIENIGYYEMPYPHPLTGYAPAGKRTDIPPRLDEAGLLKFYKVCRALDGWAFEWEERTVDILDRFMLTFDGKTLSPSTVVLFDQFCAWSDAAASTDPEAPALSELDKIFRERSGAA
jgi:hypothetical protein